ncbi:TonB-dependent receptor [Desulfobaculum bizertense]|uniref:TonB-dependent receptor plug domain-containing protein n=1 Tax=Desulfobaculum bizertense TaxID=376490 RepID=UPI001F1631CB|nr:TonB-dependent receptor [Desulfobaculum bizertense]UIJ37406.1 TonB-dependent receptor [Desulfobaculum bizertense]
MMKKSALLLFVALLTLPSLGFAAEQATAKSDTSFELGEVLVSGEKLSVVEQAGTVDVITAEEIKNSGARNVAEALDLVPGVTVRTGAEGTPRIDIRGLRTRNVILLLDGVPMNSTYDNQWTPDAIPADYISEIKITRGASSVLYGAGGNAGVINIITKKGQEGLHGLIGGELGSGEYYRAKGSLNGGTDKLRFNSYYVFETRDHFPLSGSFNETALQDSGERVNSDDEKNNIYANLLYDATDSTKLGLTVSYWDRSYGIPPATTKNDGYIKKPKYDRYDNISGNLVQLLVQHEFSDALSMKASAFMNNQEEDRSRYDDDSYSTQKKNGAYNQTSYTEIFGGNLIGTYDAKEYGTINLSLSAKQSHWKLDSEVYKESTSGSGSGSGGGHGGGHGGGSGGGSGSSSTAASSGKFVGHDESKNLDEYNIATEYEVRPTEKLGLVAGIGWHALKKITYGDDESDYSYLLGANYDLTDATSLHVNHARKVRFPSVKELYDTDSGNADLHAEVTRHYEAGVRHNFRSVDTELDVTGFYIEADDFIEKDVNKVSQNFEEYSFRGFETSVVNRSITNLTLKASYTYLDARNESDSAEIVELQYRPRNKAGVEATYTAPCGAKLYASWLYVDGQYHYSSDGKDKSLLKTYNLVDLKVSKAFFDDSLEVYAGARNLFDEDYEESYSIPQAGRTFYLGTEYRF